MADGSFDSHRGEIEDFENELIDLCFEVIEKSYDSYNAYYATFPNVLDGVYAAPRDLIDNLVAPTSPYDFDTSVFNHAKYRDDIAYLTSAELPRFLDNADLAAFDEIDARLREAAGVLDLAVGYYGFEQLLVIMDKWSGTAAYNFQHEVLAGFETRLVHQLVFINEIGAVSRCLRELIERSRGDGLGLAQDLLKKVDRSRGSISLGTVLWVVGSVAAGIASFGTSAPVTAAVLAARTAFVVNTAAGAIGQVQQLQGRTGAESRKIEGDTAYDFIPSCQEQVDRVIQEGQTEAATLMGALDNDLSAEGIQAMSMAKPAVLEGTSDFQLVESGSGGNYRIESVADLRFAGVVLLPTMAQYFHDAHENVDGLAAVFDRAVGWSPVADVDRHKIADAVSVLATSFAEARDFLHQAGVELTEVADAYLATEEDNEAMMTSFNLQLDEVNTDLFPQYQP